jgi:enterochelin esterase-like enzyme
MNAATQPNAIHLRHRLAGAKHPQLIAAWSSQPLPLIQGADGFWSADISGLEPGIHAYHIVEAGTTAPPLDQAPVVHLLHIPSAKETVDAPEAARGTLIQHRYHSTAFAMTRTLWLYLPQGYDASTEALPLMVLQQAGADSHAHWVRVARLDWLLDAQIAAGITKPMAVVMLSNHPQGEPLIFEESTRAAALAELEAEIFNDALPLITSTYRVQTSAVGTALVGPSLGGGQALTFGLSHPERFAWIGAFSPGYGVVSTQQTAIAQGPALDGRLKLLWLSSARSDEQFANNCAFEASLTQQGIRHIWKPVDGGHNWGVWRSQLSELLPQLFR